MTLQNDPAEMAENYVSNLNAIVFLYRILEDPIDKFIIMACLQLGYSQEIVANMLGVSQPIVSLRLKNARAMLKLKESAIIF